MAPDATATTLHDLLAGVPIFRDLTPEELGRIITLAKKVLWALCRTLSLRLRETTDRIVALFAIIARPF